MTQERINNIFKSHAGLKFNSLFTTSDDRIYTTREAAENYCHDILEEGDDVSKYKITEWLRNTPAQTPIQKSEIQTKMITLKHIDPYLLARITDLINLAEIQNEMALSGILHSYLGCRLMGRDNELARQFIPFLNEEKKKVQAAADEINKSKLN